MSQTSNKMELNIKLVNKITAKTKLPNGTIITVTPGCYSECVNNKGVKSFTHKVVRELSEASKEIYDSLINCIFINRYI